MKRVLIVSNSSSGVYDSRRELLMELAHLGYEVAVLCPDNDKTAEIEQLGFRIIAVEMDKRGVNPFHDLKLLFSLRKILKEEKPELVITYTIKPNIYAGYLCGVMGIPCAINVTGLGSSFENKGFVKNLVKVMYRIAIRKVKVIFFENSFDRKLFCEVCKTPDEKTVVLSGAGVNLDHFEYIEYPEDSETFRFLFVGRIMKEKGVQELFWSMKKLLDNGFKCSLMILGRYEEEWKDEVERYEKEGWLEYYGYQPDVRPYIARAYCFVLPSYHEGMANTNLECAASGRPVITSNIPGCREAVINGITGLLCEPRDESSLYETMRQMISASNEDRKTMGKKGRRHMMEVFEKKSVVEKTIKAIFG
ncbi:MAG: glycosyltransferase family 4 protein [Clostridia bacterium]|nr:glycosyltransferase family 4 protein [Clostridia bacterium]